MINIQSLTDRDALKHLIYQAPLQPFLQSWAWGEFQAGYGRRIWRLGAWEDKQLVGAALVIEHQLMLGQKYLYCPRGPIAMSSEAVSALYLAIQQLGQNEGAMYVKIDPPTYEFSFSVNNFPPGFTPGTPLQPRQTLVVDIDRPEESLLASMHQKTRYNLRLAEKRGVTIRWSTEAEDFQKFLGLMHDTYTRQGIRLHPDAYYQQMFSVLQTVGMGELGLVEYQGQIIAGNLVIWHGQTATYLHGGSAEDHKEVMAPHLLQWQTILRAKAKGCTMYDLWGIAPEDVPDHAWSGVTRFKKGFGGRVLEFPPAANAILQSSWYWAYRMAKRMRGGVDE